MDMGRWGTMASLILAVSSCGEGGDAGGGPSSPEVRPTHPGERPLGSGLRLVEVGALTGVDRPLTCGREDTKAFMPEANGAGAALFDHDGDGDLDLYLVNGSTLAILRGEAPPVRNAFYENQGDWRFVEVGAAAGVDDDGWGFGCAVGDLDDDGDPDLLVTNWGANRVYRNEGTGRFAEVARDWGLADERWAHSAACADVDQDGDLDLYLTHNSIFDLERPPNGGERCRNRDLQVFCGPLGLPPEADALYRNEGGGRFVDGTAEAGLALLPARYGLGVVATDVNDDGRVDLYVANDSVPNFLLLNLGGGRFEDRGMASGAGVSARGKSQAGMGVAAGDGDGDGRPDLWVTNFGDEANAFYRSLGGASFREDSAAAGLAEPSYKRLGWGTGLEDFDRDGDLDLFVANGHVYPEVDGSDWGVSYRQADQLFENRGGGVYREHAQALVRKRPPGSSRGAAFGDLDGDGDRDVVVLEMGEPPALWRNESDAGHWLGLQLDGHASPTDGSGARLILTTGGQRQVREVTRSGSYCSSNDPRVLFGLGAAERIERLEVRWPSGVLQTFEDLPLDRYLTVDERRGILPGR